MRTRIVFGICITLLLIASAASAATVWNPVGSGSADWGDAANWTTGLPVTVAPGEVKGVFNVPGAAECVVSDTQSLKDFRQGDGADGGVIRIVDGGTLNTTGGWMAVGYSSTATLIVETGGVANFGSHLWWGMKTGADADIILNGGTITGSKDFGLGWYFGPADDHGVARVYVNRGVLNIHHWDGANAIYGDSFIDVRLGTVNITNDGDQVDEVLAFAAAGKILAFGGIGTLNVVHVGSVTTITAVHPLEPFPTNDSIVSPGDVELSWTLPDPCVPGEPVNVDVYFTDDLTALQEFTDPAAIRVVSNQNVTSVVVQVQSKTQYYWAVDSYIDDPNDPIEGPIFQLFADNAPPEVDAGADAVTWLTDGGVDVALDATVTDDEAYTVQWTVVSEPDDPNSPDAVITDPIAEDTSITLSALGEYVLQLDAFDGEYTGSDTVTINVFSDHCEAAKSLPGWIASPGDINEDCIVNILDIVILVEHWLECTGLDCDGL